MATLPPAPHDGSTGNLIQRAEPKVKASALAAFLTPLALYYVYRYVPGVASLPHELDALLATVVTGASTFAAGYAARAVDRVDLFGANLGAKASAAVTRVGEDTIGQTATSEVESKLREVASKLVEPVKDAAVDVVHAVEAAAESGVDPIAAGREQLAADTPAVVDAVHEAATEVQAAVAPAIEQAVTDAPVVAAEVAAEPPKSADELMAELRRMIAAIDAGATPIADAAQAAVAAPADVSRVPTAVIPAQTPTPVDPPTAPMAAVAASGIAAGPSAPTA